MDRRAIILLSMGHFLVDFCQGVVPALLPFLVADGTLSYAAAGGLLLASAAASSVVQPLFGFLADRLSVSWLLPASVLATGAALAVGAQSALYAGLFAGVFVSGLGVAAFHPEAARRVYAAGGARLASAMSYFSVGGNLGFAAAPLAIAGLMAALGRPGVLVLLAPTLAMTALLFLPAGVAPMSAGPKGRGGPDGGDAWGAFAILGAAVVFRSVVFAGLNGFLALYWMGRFGTSAETAGVPLAVFLGTGIVGTLLGGRLADRFGRRLVIRAGFASSAALMAFLPAVDDPGWALALLVPLGILFLAPGSILIVLGQEYVPGRIGLASGVTTGLAVSVGGLVAPLLGRAADLYGVEAVLPIVTVAAVGAAVLALALPEPTPRVVVSPA